MLDDDKLIETLTDLSRNTPLGFLDLNSTRQFMYRHNARHLLLLISVLVVLIKLFYLVFISFLIVFFIVYLVLVFD